MAAERIHAAVVSEVDAAWDAVHEALPARWQVGPVTYDPGALRKYGQMGAVRVTARGPHPGRGKAPQTVAGTGEDETAARCDLDARLRGRDDSGGYLPELRQRLRLAYVDGAETFSREHTGTGLTADELAGAIRRFPGQ